MGLKVGENKNLLVKDYQGLLQSKSIIITNEENIREITTFVKHITSSGNIRYAADVGHDDTVMTVVNMTSIIQKYEYKEMVEEWINNFLPKDLVTYINGCLNQIDHVESLDYGQVLRLRKQNLKKYGNAETKNIDNL